MKILSKRHISSAFTLIEIMLVLAIVAILVTAGVSRLRGTLEPGRAVAARSDIGAMVAGLRGYAMLNGHLPTTDQGLLALVRKPTSGPIPRSWRAALASEEDLLDPWRHRYQYRNPGFRGDEFDVYSMGPDGVESGDDIGNWR